MWFIWHKAVATNEWRALIAPASISKQCQGGVGLYLHAFVLWALDWGWIEQTLDSRQSPPETEVFFSLSKQCLYCLPLQT